MITSPVSRFFSLLFLIGALVVPSARAQENSPCPRALEMAQTEFDAGLFERSSQRISVCLERGEFSKEETRQAYLLLGMIYYANLQIEQARDSLRNLLENDPSVELVPEENFKPGFVDLFTEVRSELQPAPIPTPIPAPRSGPHRSGFWASVGLGPAGSELTCQDCDVLPEGDPWRGGSGGGLSIAIGGSLDDQLLIGGEFNHWGRTVEGNPRSAAISTLSAIIRFYPTKKTDFFLKGGLGIGGLALEGEFLRIDNSGASIQLGLGYDIRLGQRKRFALSPFAQLVAVIAEGGQTRVAGRTITGPENPGFAQIGLAATWF